MLLVLLGFKLIDTWKKYKIHQIEAIVRVISEPILRFLRFYLMNYKIKALENSIKDTSCNNRLEPKN